MPSLLSLPREIRDEIIDYVIASQRSPPTTRHDDSSERNTRIQFEDTHWREIGNLMHFESSPTAFRPAFAGLLLACQQLRAETLERESKLDVPMVLDLIVVDEEQIWLTWLSIPLIKKNMIESLDIKYRFLCDGHEQLHRTSNTGKWCINFVTQLGYLMCRILAVGSAGPLYDTDRQKTWTGARYKFNDTIRFEHEYIPHYSIRMLTLESPYWLAEREFSDCIQHDYLDAIRELLFEVAYPDMYYSKQPGWILLREKIGGIIHQLAYSRPLLGTDDLDDCSYPDLNDVYSELGQDERWTQYVTVLMEIRRANGL